MIKIIFTENMLRDNNDILNEYTNNIPKDTSYTIYDCNTNYINIDTLQRQKDLLYDLLWDLEDIYFDNDIALSFHLPNNTTTRVLVNQLNDGLYSILNLICFLELNRSSAISNIRGDNIHDFMVFKILKAFEDTNTIIGITGKLGLMHLLSANQIVVTNIDSNSKLSFLEISEFEDNSKSILINYLNGFYGGISI